MLVSLLTLLIISGASMQISYASELDTIKENTDCSSSISKQEEKYHVLNNTLSDVQPDVQHANLNQHIHTDQSLIKSFSEKFQGVTQYVYNLWHDPFGFKDVLEHVNFN